MRLLTVHQPWADLIVQGHKRFENRTWATAYRGVVAIHAGRSTGSLGFVPTVRASVQEYGGPTVFGSVIGIVELVGCHLSVPDAPFAEGPICWEFSRPVALRYPIPWRGALGLVGCPEELEADILAQL